MRDVDQAKELRETIRIEIRIKNKAPVDLLVKAVLTFGEDETHDLITGQLLRIGPHPEEEAAFAPVRLVGALGHGDFQNTCWMTVQSRGYRRVAIARAMS